MNTFKALRMKSGKWIESEWDDARGMELYHHSETPELLDPVCDLSGDIPRVEQRLGEPVEVCDVLVIPVEEVPDSRTLKSVAVYLNHEKPSCPSIDFLRNLADAIGGEK